MSALARIRSDHRASVARQKAARRMGDRVVRLMPDFAGKAVPDTVLDDRGVDSPGRLVRRGRVIVRTGAEPDVATAWAVGQNVRAARLRAGMTQEELAERTGMARPNIARVESGRHATSTDTLRRIAEALGVAVAALLAVPAPGLDEDDLTLVASGVGEWNATLDREDGA